MGNPDESTKFSADGPCNRQEYLNDLLTNVDYDKLNSDFWSIYLEKTIGESRQRIDRLTHGEGIECARRTHRFFTQITDQAISERRKRIIMPAQATAEADVSTKIITWERERKELLDIPGQSELDESYLKTALMHIIEPIRTLQERFEFIREPKDFKELRDEVLAWAERRRLNTECKK